MIVVAYIKVKYNKLQFAIYDCETNTMTNCVYD